MNLLCTVSYVHIPRNLLHHSILSITIHQPSSPPNYQGIRPPNQKITKGGQATRSLSRRESDENELRHGIFFGLGAPICWRSTGGHHDYYGVQRRCWRRPNPHDTKARSWNRALSESMGRKSDFQRWDLRDAVSKVATRHGLDEHGTIQCTRPLQIQTANYTCPLRAIVVLSCLFILIYVTVMHIYAATFKATATISGRCCWRPSPTCSSFNSFYTRYFWEDSPCSKQPRFWARFDGSSTPQIPRAKDPWTHRLCDSHRTITVLLVTGL
ncbi:hypothetical protein BJ170DRAFT_444330 [Xylariales sp. AK1849]|nr:hypothetical protein BJ170DRAFT_444330 [Xylariales sp. AK1849]